ncbi:unnamed protein product, partial [Onchocerca ochengi]
KTRVYELSEFKIFEQTNIDIFIHITKSLKATIKNKSTQDKPLCLTTN